MNVLGSSSDICNRGPYRATRLWLEAIEVFRKAVPVRKHRRNIRNYENCFAANEAISSFHEALNKHFGRDVSREQVVLLCQKFYKFGIFTSVAPKRNYSKENGPDIVNETDFKDNRNLYRFGSTHQYDYLGGGTASSIKKLSPSKSKSPKKQSPVSLQKPQKNYSVIIHALSAQQINDIWKHVWIKRFLDLIGAEVYQAIEFPDQVIRGDFISHNLTFTWQKKFAPQDKLACDIPAWLLSALKCLATWPNHKTGAGGAMGLEHVNYPGFENDVFKLVVDFYKSYRGIPLLTKELYDVFITAFIKAELFDFNCRLYSSKTTSHNSTIPTSSVTTNSVHQTQKIPPRRPVSMLAAPTYQHKTSHYSQEPYPYNASESVEDLVMEILTPSLGRERKSRPRLRNLEPTQLFGPRNRAKPPPRTSATLDYRKSQDNISSNCSLTSNSSDFKSTTLPLPMSPKSYNIDKYKNPIFYETAFTGVESPITRVVSHTELKCTLPRAARTYGKNSPRVSPGAMSSPANFAYVNPVLELSASDMINHPKYSDILKSGEIQNCEDDPPTSFSFVDYTAQSFLNSSDSSGCSSMNQSGMDISPPFQGKQRRPSRSASAANLSDDVTDRSPYQPLWNEKPCQRVLKANTLVSQYANSPSKGARRTLDFYYGADACIPGLLTAEGKQMAISAFRLLTLLLPPGNRKHLHLLLRCMSKMARNDKLILDVGVTNRAVAINTFFRRILYPTQDQEFDELLALRIVTFMMDNATEIFSYMAENSMAEEATKIIIERQTEKIPMKARSASPEMTFYATASSDDNKSESCENLVEENKENELDSSLQFCKPISIDEYHTQKFHMKSQSLRDLLDAIVQDENIGEKEKAKRLKNFRDTYPNIYVEKFGVHQCELLNKSKKTEKRTPFGNIFKKVF